MGLLTTSIATLHFARTSAARDQDRFTRLVDRQVDRLREQVGTYVALLRGTAGLFAARPDLTGADFSAYIRRLNLTELYPGVQGLGFAKRFEARARDAVVEAQRAQGDPTFAIRPETPRTEYSAILYLEPRNSRNAAAIGFDMFSEPTRRAAMERARDNAEPVLSGRVELIQEIDRDRQAGFLIYLPTYTGSDIPQDLEARRGRLTGWVYAPFRTRDLFSQAGLTASARRNGVSLAIYDSATPSPTSLLYSTAGDGEGEAERTLTRTLTLFGRPWVLRFATTRGFAQASDGWIIPLVFGLGTLVSLLLAGGVLAQARSAVLAETARNALQEETERLEILNRLGSVLASELDGPRLSHTIIEAATNLTGAAYGALFERVPAGREGNLEDLWRLASLAGAPQEAFTRFGLPRPTNLFGPTFRAEGVLRSDDVATDPRYGSHGGMPHGHLPVRSYLAVPVVSSVGVTVGALLFGHPEPARFGEREERLIVGLAWHAAIALDNARLVASVRHEQDRFRAAVQAVRGLLWTTDAEGRMVGDQPAWSTLTGQSEQDYAGFGWANVVHPDDAQETLDAWKAAVADKRTFMHEHRLRRSDGVYRHYAVRAVPIRDDADGVREWVGVHTDITEQREAEAELKESNEEIQRYAYIVSHDLRAPLVNITGFTSELDTTRADIRVALGADPRALRIDEDFGEALGFIKAAIGKMDRLIAAILKLSRDGRRTFRPEPLDMAALTRGLVDAQRHQIGSAGAEVVVADDLPGLVADRLAMEQIFGNLIDNAVKYLVPERPGRIEVSGQKLDATRARFVVRDNGRGIAQKDHERIFELFRRSGVQDRPGEGIGLAHVRTLVRALGGRIELMSEVGAGTALVLVLPTGARTLAA